MTAPATATAAPAGRLARLRGASGQAAVELLALVPLLALVAIGAFHVLAAGSASEAASAAAEAGAVALLEDRDPADAARRAAGAHRDAVVRVEGHRVTVSVEPHLPIHALAALLGARATADAGPQVHAVRRPARGGDGTSASPPPAAGARPRASTTPPGGTAPAAPRR